VCLGGGGCCVQLAEQPLSTAMSVRGLLACASADASPAGADRAEGGGSGGGGSHGAVGGADIAGAMGKHPDFSFSVASPPAPTAAPQAAAAAAGDPSLGWSHGVRGGGGGGGGYGDPGAGPLINSAGGAGRAELRAWTSTAMKGQAAVAAAAQETKARALEGQAAVVAVAAERRHVLDLVGAHDPWTLSPPSTLFVHTTHGPSLSLSLSLSLSVSLPPPPFSCAYGPTE
jgi:hypothetical protein